MATRQLLAFSISVTAFMTALGPVAWSQASAPTSDTDQSKTTGQTSTADAAQGSEEVVVTADRVKLLETKPNDTVFGIKKSLLKTPRSATFVSDTTMERYGVQTINDLTAVSPSTYTASFFGVPGAVDIRGTLGEDYFNGFKRIENRGTYTTPLGAASQVEIVRGPPSPVYGSGKVGGFLNFIPKTSRTANGDFESYAKVTATVGTYDMGEATVEGATPLDFGAIKGGLYAYAEIEDGDRYYRGISPEHQLFEATADFDLGPGWTTKFGGMIYRSQGDVQTPGWNRITQDLINNQTYITGRDTDLRDFDGNGRITPNEVAQAYGQGGSYPFSSGLDLFYFGGPAGTDPVHQLDTDVGTTKLDRRTVYISPADFSNTRTNTAFFDLTKTFSDDSSIKLQLFYDDLNNERFVSYGYPAAFDSSVWETRLSYAFDVNVGDLITSQNVVGASFRDFEGRRRESYNSGDIALDRRDLSEGATPDDIMDSPFDNDPVVYFAPGVYTGIGWENDNMSRWNESGLFYQGDITIAENLNLMLGARYDWYNVRSIDTGGDNTGISFQPAGVWKANDGKFTWSASLSYQLPWGLMPYYTYAKTSALEMSQAGDIAPNLIQGDGWISDGQLNEGGIKFKLLGGTLVGALDYYEQKRTNLVSGPTPTVQEMESKGTELELRYLATDNISFTFSGSNQKTVVKGPDTSFAYLPWYTVGTDPTDAFGGAYVTFGFNSVQPGDYKYTLIPDTVVSLYGTYTSDTYNWGQFGGTFGLTHASKTSGTVPNAVVYPSYSVFNGSIFYAYENYSVTLNCDNIFDKLYFTPGADVYANLSAIPAKGRLFRLTISASF